MQDFVSGLASVGNAPALIAFAGGQPCPISYAALAEAVRALAADPAHETPGAGEPIAIVGPNTVEWVMAFLAIVASGVTVMPLDGRLGVDELCAALARGLHI